MGLKRIRRAIRENRYEFTSHAIEEMDEDELDERDVRHSVLNGEIDSELTDDPRGVRFVVRGPTYENDRDILRSCAGFSHPGYYV